MAEITTKLKSEMERIISLVREEVAGLRTGRATATLVDSLPIPYYGSIVPLKQLASITVPEPTVILIQPWDKQATGDIEQAIRTSPLGLSPLNEGGQIRLVLPPLTAERRAQLVKTLHQKGEGGKVGLRAVRKAHWEKIQAMVKASTLTEDDKYRYEDELNKIIDHYNQKIDTLLEDKEKELRLV